MVRYDMTDYDADMISYGKYMFSRYDMISPYGMLLLDLRQYDMIGHDTGYCMI